MKKFYSTLLFAILMVVTQVGYSMSILVVNDNNHTPNRVKVIEKAIEAAGYKYTTYDVAAQGQGPSYDFMKAFNLVIWYTGDDRVATAFWNGNDSDNDAIKSYIDGGGMLWVQGLDFMRDRYPGADTTFKPGSFPYDYLGIKEYYADSHIDDGTYSDGVPELDVVKDNGIFTLSPIKWRYSSGTMWYVDAWTPTDNAKPIYQMGPKDYDLSAYYSVIYNEKGKGKVLACGFETARMDTLESPDMTTTFMKQGLDYFNQFAPTEVLVNSVEIKSPDGFTIDKPKGTLQLTAVVKPDNATNKTILWQVIPETATADITQDGLLTATGTPVGEGKLWVKASAVDGSGVADSVEITITNQMDPNAYYVLLVNDDNNTYGSGTIRYQIVDTAITHAGYPVDVFNTVTQTGSPSYDLMKRFKFVVWYTGNDGANQKLWDPDDSTRFNPDLVKYIDNGGVVWVQGLDFLYDAFGNKYRELLNNGDSCIAQFHKGDFMYDYAGIKAYVAQSHRNDNKTGVAELDVVPNNGICTMTPIKWKYSTLWNADALEITDNAQGIYTMGPSDYIFSNYYAMLENVIGKGHVLISTFETARMDTQDNTDELFKEVLDYYRDNVNSVKNHAVDDIADKVYPNPVNHEGHLVYTLKKGSEVSVSITDITGKVVYDQTLGFQSAGRHQVPFSVQRLDLNNGVYFYTIFTDNGAHTGKIIVKK
jgi:hypothetical protein